MGRPNRRDEPGDTVHLFNRGLRHSDIAFNDDDRFILIDEVVRAVAGVGGIVLAYCIMGNHHHWLLKFPYGGLSQTMHQSMSCYVREFNQRHDFDGPMFRARFGSKLVDTPFYLRRLSRYVHRNPKDIGWQQNLERYPFSSLSGYLDSQAEPFWLKTQTVLDHFTSRESYRSYVLDEPLQLSSIDLRNETCGQVIADALSTCDVEVIEAMVADQFEIGVSALWTPSSGKASAPRKTALVLASRYGAPTPEALAARYQISTVRGLRRSTTEALAQLGKAQTDLATMRVLEARIRNQY